MMPSSHQPNNHVSLSPSSSSSASSSPNPNLLSPTGAVQQQSLLSPTTNNNNQLDAPNPFTQRQAIRSKKIKRQQGSSRFITAANKELEPLPAIRGMKNIEKKKTLIIM